MTKYTVIQLKNFKGGLHLARGLTNAYDKTLDTLHSDKLKSAIFVSALQLYGAKQIDQSFLESFQISSAFPFYHSPTRDQPFYFFPKPEMVKLPFHPKDAEEKGIEKKLKQIRFIETSLFEGLLKGDEAFYFNKSNLRGNFITSEAIDFARILERDNCEAILQSQTYQHVSIARDYGTDSTPYYVDKIYFHQNAGLFFLLEGEEEVKRKVVAAMKLLADSGIGTDRHSGNGQFEMAESQLSLDVPATGTHQINLSLYCPEKAEIEDSIQKSYYGLTKRGGYISSPENPAHLTIRKRSIYMFTEGSIFPPMEGRKGKIVDLAPDNSKLPNSTVNHPVWRDGQSIFLPFNYKTNES